ncbi:hypothetical protein [Halorussus litoreus]|uniref:hypothetical protein n=1 Tax=Halorussus litoreus TaxID=1710536 RepID=UPI000E26A3A4|nr:hypothetical protein [Halorussus litoreus]
MPSRTISALLAAVRVVFVVAGLGIAVATVLQLASMPPPPPESDGFAHGMAGLIGGVIIVLTLGLAAVGVSLPSLLGREDRLGFNPWQRFALKGAGVLIGGGLVAGLAVGLLTELQFGVIFWLGLVFLATGVVCATLVWRLSEALVRLLARVAGETNP